MDRPHQADVTLHKCGYTYSARYTWWALADSNRMCFAVCPRSLDYCALRTRIEIAHIGRSFRSGEHATLSRSMSHILRCAQMCLLSNNDYRSLDKGTEARSDGDQKSDRPILTSRETLPNTCLTISQATLSPQVSCKDWNFAILLQVDFLNEDVSDLRRSFWTTTVASGSESRESPEWARTNKQNSRSALTIAERQATLNSRSWSEDIDNNTRRRVMSCSKFLCKWIPRPHQKRQSM